MCTVTDVYDSHNASIITELGTMETFFNHMSMLLHKDCWKWITAMLYKGTYEQSKNDLTEWILHFFPFKKNPNQTREHIYESGRDCVSFTVGS